MKPIPGSLIIGLDEKVERQFYKLQRPLNLENFESTLFSRIFHTHRQKMMPFKHWSFVVTQQEPPFHEKKKLIFFFH